MAGDDRLAAAIRELVAAIRAEIIPAAAPDAPIALLSVEEAARRLGVGRTMLYREIAAGHVRSVKIGRRRVIPADAIGEYVRRAGGGGA